MTEIRLSKIMTDRGICSRREADRFIEEGLVCVDGVIITTLGTKVHPDVQIELLPLAQKRQASKVTILLHKPVGYVSTQPEKNYAPAIDLIVPENQIKGQNLPKWHESHLNKLAVVGRLDIDSKGLLVFTQDGVLAKSLIGENSEVEKEYLVRFEGNFYENTLDYLSHGLSIDGKALKRAQVDLLEDNVLRVILREGKKRQVRRMCEMVGLHVISLKRVRVGNVRLGDLPSGRWRYLNEGESFI